MRLYLIIFLWSLKILSSVSREGNERVRFSGNFALLNKLVTRNQAVQDCANAIEGGNLASFETAEKRNVLKQFIEMLPRLKDPSK